MCRRMFVKAETHDKRIKSLSRDEVRIIDSKVDSYPRVHGSELFTQGKTQMVVTTTLGDSGMRKKTGQISGMTQKRLYL